MSTMSHLDFLTVTSRIITFTSYACRHLTVTLSISNNGKPWWTRRSFFRNEQRKLRTHTIDLESFRHCVSRAVRHLYLQRSTFDAFPPWESISGVHCLQPEHGQWASHVGHSKAQPATVSQSKAQPATATGTAMSTATGTAHGLQRFGTTNLFTCA